MKVPNKVRYLTKLLTRNKIFWPEFQFTNTSTFYRPSNKLYYYEKLSVFSCPNWTVIFVKRVFLQKDNNIIIRRTLMETKTMLDLFMVIPAIFDPEVFLVCCSIFYSPPPPHTIIFICILTLFYNSKITTYKQYKKPINEFIFEVNYLLSNSLRFVNYSYCKVIIGCIHMS